MSHRVSLCPAARRAAPSGAVALALCILAAPALAGPFAFAVNRASNDITVVDTWGHTYEYTLPTAPEPLDAAPSPDGATLYVATRDYVTEIDLRTLERFDHPYDAGLSEGNSIVVHPNGRTLWVSHRSASFVSRLDLQTGRMTSIPMGVFDIRHLAISESGSWVFGVTHLGDVVQLDTATSATTLLFDDVFPFATGIATGRTVGSSIDVAIASDANLTVEAFTVSAWGSASTPQVLASGFRTGGLARSAGSSFLAARPFDNAIHRTFAGVDIPLGAGAAPLDVAQHDDSIFRVSANLGDVTGQAPAGHGSISFITALGVTASLPAGRETRAVTIGARRGEELMGDPGVAEFPYFRSGSTVRRSVEILSVGDEDAFIWDVHVAGPDASAFQVVGGSCRHQNLSYQQRCAVVVEFTAIPKPPPPWARFLEYYVRGYSAQLVVNDGVETTTSVPMRAGAYVKRPEVEVVDPPPIVRPGLFDR